MFEIEAKVNRLAEQVKKLKESDKMIRTEIHQLQKQLEKMKNVCTCEKQEQEINSRARTQAQAIPITITEAAPFLNSLENLHDEVLRENLPRMVDDMELQRTYLLDELIEDDVISSDEGSTIRKAGNRQAQTRTLVSIISRRSSSKFETFLKRLGEQNNYPPVAKTITDSYNRKHSEYWQSGSTPGSCFPCSVIKKVNLEDVVDMLLKHGVVHWDFLDHIRESKNPSSLWMHVFKRIHNASNRLELINCLHTALNRKHPEIAEMLNGGYPHSFNCYCKLKSSAACLEFTELSVDFPDYCSSLGYIVTSSEDRESILSGETMSNEFITPYRNNQSSNPPAVKTREWFSSDIRKRSKSSVEIRRWESLPSVKQSSDKYEDWLSNYKYKRPIQNKNKDIPSAELRLNQKLFSDLEFDKEYEFQYLYNWKLNVHNSQETFINQLTLTIFPSSQDSQNSAL